jgi:hypothetical protein
MHAGTLQRGSAVRHNSAAGGACCWCRKIGDVDGEQKSRGCWAIKVSTRGGKTCAIGVLSCLSLVELNSQEEFHVARGPGIRLPACSIWHAAMALRPPAPRTRGREVDGQGQRSVADPPPQTSPWAQSMRLAFFLLAGYPLCAVPCLRVRRALVRSCVRLCFPAAFLSQQLKRHDKQSPAVCVGCANGRGGECEQCGAYHSLTGAHKTLADPVFFFARRLQRSGATRARAQHERLTRLAQLACSLYAHVQHPWNAASQGTPPTHQSRKDARVHTRSICRTYALCRVEVTRQNIKKVSSPR